MKKFSSVSTSMKSSSSVSSSKDTKLFSASASSSKAEQEEKASKIENNSETTYPSSFSFQETYNIRETEKSSQNLQSASSKHIEGAPDTESLEVQGIRTPASVASLLAEQENPAALHQSVQTRIKRVHTEDNPESKAYILPQVLPDLLEDNPQSIQEALEFPYKHMAADDKLDLIQVLPQSKDLKLKYLENLFTQNEDLLSEEEKKEVHKAKVIRKRLATHIRMQNKQMNAWSEDIEQSYGNKSSQIKQQALEEDKRPSLLSSSHTMEQERDAETSLADNEDILLSHKLVSPPPLKTRNSFFLRMLKSLLNFGQATLSTDLKSVQEESRLRFMSLEIPFVFLAILSLAWQFALPYFTKILQNTALGSSYLLSLDSTVFNLLVLGLPLLFLLKTPLLKQERIFGHGISSTQYSNYFLLLLSSLPLGLFLKSFHNLCAYFFARIHFYITLNHSPSLNSYLQNSSNRYFTLLALLLGILLPVLLQGFLFRGVFLGNLLYRKFNYSAVFMTALASAFLDFHNDFLFTSLGFALFVSLVRYWSSSLLFSMLVHFLSLLTYFFTPFLLKTLWFNTQVIGTITGDRIFQSSLISLLLSGLILFSIFRHYVKWKREENWINGLWKKNDKILPFSLIFLLTLLLLIVFRFYSYFF